MMEPVQPLQPTSSVEQRALARSGFDQLRYPPTEKIGVLVVDNFPDLGRITALRFLEWVQEHPEGVISLPTGKTPEYFIKWTIHFLKTWNEPETRKTLEAFGLDPARKPDLRGLTFVQIDEFYPIDPQQPNSFYYYVQRFYIRGFGLDPQRALLIDATKIGLPRGLTLQEVWPNFEVDLSLRFRQPRSRLEHLQKQVLEAVDEWCQQYEERIRALGGIGFFLGGIGPDGHIAFNVRGSDHFSTTRLTYTNYETQAAAAVDLGGIEIARKRPVITIGLATITYNPEAVAIIFAAGEAKARVVRDAIEEEPHIRYPATALHKLRHARFFITRGAAKLLRERQYRWLQQQSTWAPETVEQVAVDLALKKRKRIEHLTPEDFQQDPLGQLWLQRISSPVPHTLHTLRTSLEEKILRGMTLRKNTTFLHTAPHHDDIMLGYLPYAVRHIRDASNRHVFAYMTSGFTAVSNTYALEMVRKLQRFLENRRFQDLWEQGYFDPQNIEGRNRDVWQYLDGIAARSQPMKEEGEARRLLRNLVELYGVDSLEQAQRRVELLAAYFESQPPGVKDRPDIQRFKGMIREWEADCLWGYFGFNHEAVKHLRLGFYTGDIFTEEPTIPRDVMPIVRLLHEVKPDVVTVAFDPEASGPDTHYKVLQAIAEALKIYERETNRHDLVVVGYRNVWYRFHPAEANVFVPVSLNMFAVMENSFMNAFGSQRAASFPSYEHDGPFSELAQKIQVEQYQKIKLLLGREFFHGHPSPLIRATRGLVFLREMPLEEFYAYARELRKTTENR